MYCYISELECSVCDKYTKDIHVQFTEELQLIIVGSVHFLY